MWYHKTITNANLHSLIKNGSILFGGNKILKLYGTLYCASGKRMKRGNRVFFTSETEAIKNGYRPCAHCMRAAYNIWKATQITLAL